MGSKKEKGNTLSCTETEVMLRKLKVKKIYLYFIQSAERQADFFNLATDWDGNLLANDGFEITFSHEAF